MHVEQRAAFDPPLSPPPFVAEHDRRKGQMLKWHMPDDEFPVVADKGDVARVGLRLPLALTRLLPAFKMLPDCDSGRRQEFAYRVLR